MSLHTDIPTRSEIARRVLLARGRVLAVRNPDMPGGGPVAAILRYAI
jgi:hypothetical protein